MISETLKNKDILNKIKKNDVVSIKTNYSNEQNYIVESNSPKKRIIKLIPLNIDDGSEDPVLSLTFAWEMIKSIRMTDKRFILFFLHHTNSKISETIKSILG